MSAPELSVQLARRALLVGATDISATTTNAGEARTLSMRAQAVLAAGLVRTSQHVSAVEPGFAALALAESGGALVLAAELRLDLAACAQEVGEPLLGGALLRPVLEATQAPPAVRASALGRLVGCIAHVARRDDIEDALSEADRLLAADDGLGSDVRRMERARLAARSAAYHRWYGDTEDAVTAARDGLALLDRLGRELRPESDRLHARLVLELVCALLDEGELHEAGVAARPTIDEPVRATSAESVGQVMLALAIRVHLPAGDVDRGRGLLDQAAWLAERHGLDSVLADALTELSRLDEQAGRTKEALDALRSARAAEQRRMRAVARAARHLLLQVSANQGSREATQQAVAGLLRQLAHPGGMPVAIAPAQAARSTLPPHRTWPEPQPPSVAGELTGALDEGTGLLNSEGLVRRLRTVRTGERPVSLTLVRFEANNDNASDDRGPDTGIMVGLADKVRDMAPENAELARSDGGELAVLMPGMTRDQAEEFAATIRETATRPGWASDSTGKDMSISTSVVQSDPPATSADTHLDATNMLTAARDALTPAQQSTPGERTSLLPDPPAQPDTPTTPPSDTQTPPHHDRPTPTTDTPTRSRHDRLAAFANSAAAFRADRQISSAEPSGSSRLDRLTATDSPTPSRQDRPAASTDSPPSSRHDRPAASTGSSVSSRHEHVMASADSAAPSGHDHAVASTDSPVPSRHDSVAAQADSVGSSRYDLLAATPVDSPPALPRRDRPTSSSADSMGSSRYDLLAAAPVDSPPALPRRERSRPAATPTPSQHSAADPKAAPSSQNASRPDPASALTEEPRTTPLNTTQSGDTATGRSILSSLSIPSGSGGRRRAAGEPDPGTASSRPDETPRVTRAERRATEEATTSSGTGWPAEPDVSQRLIRTPAERQPAERPSSYEETRAELAQMMSTLNAKALRARGRKDGATEPRAGSDADRAEAVKLFNIAELQQALAPRQSIPTAPEPEEVPEPPRTPDIPEPPPLPDAPTPPGPGPLRPEHPAPEPPSQPETPEPPNPPHGDEPRSHWTRSDPRPEVPSREDDRRPRWSRSEPLPESPEPPLGDDRPSRRKRSERLPEASEASRRDEPQSLWGRSEPLPEAAEPPRSGEEAAPWARSEPPNEPPQDPAGEERSGLLAAFDALMGPVLSRRDNDDTTDRPTFRTEFDDEPGLPSREPLTSWSALESASVVDSPAEDLFGEPLETPHRSSLGAAFADFAAGDPPPARPEEHEIPKEPPAPQKPAEERMTMAELRAALWERVSRPTPEEPVGPTPPSPQTPTPEPTAPPTAPADALSAWVAAHPANEASSAEHPPAHGTNGVAAHRVTEVSSTVGEWSDRRNTPADDSGKSSTNSDPRPSASDDVPSGPNGRPSGDGWTPSTASAAPTYDEPIGPRPRPHGLPRRGERSATTIASLLTEALAAYQSTTDDQQEPAHTPDRGDSPADGLPPNPGRHRSAD
ncbi:hypothetical protein [Actinophytocola oryzae]|uniref:GGDEF domain-containing protein n=1 Tax=Actinophytocola oryzae TaxID=502181 RepID=A0A4R7UUA6_9PSEU|nr:hypothetical protein [Actinophytocola oryzae]TDV38752.1 GGDEF domain-containing protein [Actinophytocola oryzae]